MKPKEIAVKYVTMNHDALTDNQEIIDMTNDIKDCIREKLHEAADRATASYDWEKDIPFVNKESITETPLD